MTKLKMRSGFAVMVLFASIMGLWMSDTHATEALPTQIRLVWSPSGKLAAFTTDENGQDDISCPTELYELDLDAKTLQHLLQARPGNLPDNDLSCFYEVKYSTDGEILYFVTPAWATSGAIQAYNRRTGEVHFVIDGGPYLVIATGPMSGMLLVVRRKYPDDLGQGAYEEIDLIDPLRGAAIPLPKILHGALNEAGALNSVQKLLQEREGWISW